MGYRSQQGLGVRVLWEREESLGVGLAADVAPELRASASISDEQVQALVTERDVAKKRRDFARADQIRKELAEKGIIIEDSKDGTRWKRK